MKAPLRDRLRAARWALAAVRTARRQLANGGVDALVLPRVPSVPHEAKGGVELVMRTVGRNCLVRAAVRQAWYAAHGRAYDLIIGITPPAKGFKAHAWLELDVGNERFEELLRRPASKISTPEGQ
jgi:hypothetical protein